MMLKYIVCIALLIIILGFPEISGFATMPPNLEPIRLGKYFGGVLEYWALVFRGITTFVNKSQVLNGGIV